MSEGLNTNVRIIPTKIKSIELKMDGEQNCYLGELRLNGIDVRRGISSVELVLIANENPQVVIIGDKNRMEDSVKKSWGII
jgi:hypothetical protein